VFGHFSERCYEAVCAIGLLYEEGGVDVFDIDADFFWALEYPNFLQSVKLFLQVDELVPVV